MDTIFEASVLPQKPKTATVLALLLTAAATLSYLGAYAISTALVQADIIRQWSSEEDPRPRWMCSGFVALCGIFAFFAIIARILSQRQLQRLDAIAEE
jgi:TRAP-type C4-dicarboxylate transport system permease small subunit